MAAREKYAFDEEPAFVAEEQPAAHHLMLGSIETLLNAFIELDAESYTRACKLDGLVVRVKIIDPYKVFYLHFTYEGIEVSDQQPGVVKVRVGGRLTDILSYVLGITAPENSQHIRLWGEAESIQVLRDLLREFNLRTAAQRWLREHVNVEGLWQKVRNHDPSWLSDFMPMPGLMRDTLIELRSLNQTLRQQQDEFVQFRASLRQQRAQDMVFLIMAFVAIILALGGLHGLADIGQLNGDKIALLVMGVALVLDRLRRNI
jgi:hypothetical protein